MPRKAPVTYKSTNAWSVIKSIYDPTIWIEGEHMYATCDWLSKKSYSDTSQAGRRTFENRLWRALKNHWGVLAETLTLDYQTGRVRINFINDEEFIMAKMTQGSIK